MSPLADCTPEAEWLEQVARQQGIGEPTLLLCRPRFRIDEKVLRRQASQPEAIMPPSAYLERCVSESRISTGRAKMACHQSLFRRLADAGLEVDPAILVAIWGIESGFGTFMGGFNAIEALSTLSCRALGRQRFFVDNLVAALEIVERGIASAEGLLGSWAGAMGHTQFMPRSFLNYGISLTEGPPDIWSADPSDAIASAANFLVAAGWKAGEPVLSEAVLPSNFDLSVNFGNERRRLSEWENAGVSFLDVDAGLLAEMASRLILPAGAGGPALAAFENFDAIGNYNRSLNYQLAVALLARAVDGRGDIQASWPEAHHYLSRSETVELQRLLHLEGHDTGGIDGLVGPATRAAVQSVQVREGWPADGFPDRRLLLCLRQRHDVPSQSDE